MWLPQTRGDWQQVQAIYREIPRLRTSEKKVIRRNANWLLEHLYVPRYVPRADIGACVSNEALRKAGIEGEPVNWGDLGVSVKKRGRVWVVELEEASAEQCPTLCEYVRGWLEKWGWPNVAVEMKW